MFSLRGNFPLEIAFPFPWNALFSPGNEGFGEKELLDSLFKEVRVFKVSDCVFRNPNQFGNAMKVKFCGSERRGRDTPKQNPQGVPRKSSS